ncbi:ABC transporter substrate-binding protein [Lacticaseibacillus zeae DSM 20178 = KCTC 3804]|uniref:ABC transporter substrate-binding protein n=2 Tax=Lacticaseibacillus zeae TaxID=57037 RepID=A0A5R8LTU6_LACZE|nr:ABC transporter substrate-binding protein [Lacticaseibacillus zeae]KRK12673.1 ABC transporter substrate-binding protein [Lacticaseibacillus zeae DSM 20178 = KCTC 3804]OLS11545.1 ABC transporter substrate-binding protein [Lacticaseibacillus casei]QVI32659.1 ABC transporter substrate-binding protein [Lacticaseibacillus zeae]TLF40687.1 ABC transporter substrate-binding protein [Lacticaseibacillus zeae]
MKKHLLLALAGMALIGLTLTGCGKQSKAASRETVKVGILQLMDQTALTEARKGFESELAKAGYKGKRIKIDYVNAQGDQANLKTMSDRLACGKNDVNLAIATPAAQALQKAEKKTPLLFTAITDPKSAGLVTNLTKPDKNATGVTDLVSVSDQIDLLHKTFPQAKTIGLMYNAGEPNSVYQIKQAKAHLKKLGLRYQIKTAATTNDVQQAAESLAKDVDALYLPADNVMAAAMPTIGKVAKEKQIPVVPAASTMVKDGGTITKGIDYRDLGKQTAKMAIKLLKGTSVKKLAVEKPANVKTVKNDDMLKVVKQKVNLPK